MVVSIHGPSKVSSYWSPLALQMVGREAEALQPLDELRGEHLPLAVKHVAAQPGGFTSRQAQRADVVQLFLQLADVDQAAEA